MKYLYLVASLPVLNIAEPPPMTVEAFLFRCEGILDPADLEDVRRLLAGEHGGFHSEAARTWSSLDTQLRNGIAQVRAGRLGVDVKQYIREHPFFDTYLGQVVVDAFAKSNPLEREWVLDQARWSQLDELALSDPYGLAAVIAFGVQLQLVHRRQQLTDERGAQALEDAMAAIMEPQVKEQA